MKKKHMKILFLFSLLISCFAGLINVSSDVGGDTNIANAQLDYSNLNFEKGYGLPSGYTCTNGSGVDTDPGYDDEGRLALANGGGSDFALSDKRPHGKRTTRFTLYENIKFEICLYTTGTGKNLIIHDGTTQLATKLAEKNTPTFFQYEFTNVPSTGKVFYLGGNSSGIFAEYITFGVSERARFDANGGTFSDGKTMIVVDRPEGGSDQVTPPEDPTNGDKIFVGWSESATGSSTTTSFEYNKTYYAVWKSAAGVSVYLDYLSLYLDVNETELVTASVLPSTMNATFTWTSSNPAIATVDQTGLVTGVSYGDCEITATFQKSSASCKVHVRELVEYVVSFYESYEDLLNGEAYSDVEVYDRETINNIPVFGTGKGYDIKWMCDNGTKENQADDYEFDFSKYITSDLNIYAVTVLVPVATLVELSVPQEINSNVIKISERNYYLSSGVSISLNVTLSRDDGRFDEVKDTQEYKSTCNDITWYSTDTTIATVSNGVVKMLRSGKVEIYAKMYENTPKYQKHILTATSIFFSNLGDKSDAHGNKIDTSVGIKAEKGRFLVAGGSEKAVRFIGFISESFFPYISEAKFRVEAIDEYNTVRKVFEYDVEYFSREITYKSKNIYSSSYFKTWSSEGKLGAALTITGLPTNEFVGKFVVTFMVKDNDTSIFVPNITSISYSGV